MGRFPKDCSQRRTGSAARGIVHYQFSQMGHWEYHEITGTDHGVDCTVELIENDEYRNDKFEGQIKGTIKPRKLKTENAFVFPMDIKTINYGLNSKNAFILLYVDVVDEIIYYIPIQDYFISKPSLFEKLETNQEKLTIHIPCDNIFTDDDFDLIQIAKSIYIYDRKNGLQRIQN